MGVCVSPPLNNQLWNFQNDRILHTYIIVVKKIGVLILINISLFHGLIWQANSNRHYFYHAALKGNYTPNHTIRIN